MTCPQVTCYNCQGSGHMSRECTKPHVPRGAHHGGGENRYDLLLRVKLLFGVLLLPFLYRRFGSGGGGGGGGRGQVGVGIQDIDLSEPLPKKAARRGGAHFGWGFGGGGRGGGVGRGAPDSQQAHIPDPHGADVTKYLKPGAPKPDFRKSRRAEPTVDQIQVARVLATHHISPPV